MNGLDIKYITEGEVSDIILEMGATIPIFLDFDGDSVADRVLVCSRDSFDDAIAGLVQMGATQKTIGIAYLGEEEDIAIIHSRKAMG